MRRYIKYSRQWLATFPNTSKVRQKYSAARRIFNSFRGVLEMCSITFYCVWHITSSTIPSNRANLGTTATCATLATEIWWVEVLIEQKAWSTTVFKQQCFFSVYPHRLKLVALLFSLTLKRCYVYLLRFSWTILCQSSISVHCKYITKRNTEVSHMASLLPSTQRITRVLN